MSVIVVNKVHIRMTLPKLMKSLMKAINGFYEALLFRAAPGGTKICYIRLGKGLDPGQVIWRIKSQTKFGAYIPNELPSELPTVACKKGKIPLKTRLAALVPVQLSPVQLLVQTHHEILEELQCKYTGLYALSKKMQHQLLESIARTIHQRLLKIIKSNPTENDNGFKLSRTYRRMHPHFADFQMILSALHALEHAAGTPRTEINEADLMAVSNQPYVFGTVPYDKVKVASGKYTEKIVKKITEHIDGLGDEPVEPTTEEDKATKQIRTELKKLSPYLPQIIREVIHEHFVPPKAPYLKMRIYGEPCLPVKEAMSPIMKKVSAVRVMRSDRMFNVLRFNIPIQKCSIAMSYNDSLMGGGKILVRPWGEQKKYKVQGPLLNEIKASLGEEAPMDESA